VRVRLRLRALQPGMEMLLDHQYQIASLIYATLYSASPQFASKLHDRGFQSNGRTFKLFTFSQLQTSKSKVVGEKLILQDPRAELSVTSPSTEFIDCLLAGLAAERTFQVGNASFELLETLIVPPPRFQRRMKFRALSPITESFQLENEQKTYLSLEDDWSEIMSRNLSRKYEALYQRSPDEATLVWRWDHSYVKKAEKRGQRLSKLKNINAIKVRGWLVPFWVEGSQELIELGYEAGFGEGNAMGFGMAEPDESF
jgi:CRISPR-associated endoribonuclease Cas6